MTQPRQTSVIIPVCNRWRLTEACLRALARTLPPGACEIHVVDNASGDETARECPSLGRALFGDAFFHHRLSRNSHFGPACNYGARRAGGEFLLFLHNDAMALPGWYEPLFEDFTRYARIAATGPVCLRPGGDMPTVQHLGVHVSPFGEMGHLHEGIPAASPLAARRRFFQAVSAACMVMPRRLFLESGGFDEAYRNGFEDVDLCARLTAGGYRMTIHPGCRIFHLADRGGRCREDGGENAERFRRAGLPHLHPDWPALTRADGCPLRLTPWQIWTPAMREAEESPSRRDGKTEPPRRPDEEAASLQSALADNPFLYSAYARLLELRLEENRLEEVSSLWNSLTLLAPLPEHLLPVLASFFQKRHPATQDAIQTLLPYCTTPAFYAGRNQKAVETLTKLGEQALVEQCLAWERAGKDFEATVLRPFFRRFHAMARHVTFSVSMPNAYMLWRGLGQDERHLRRVFPAAATPPRPECGKADSPAFSVLMPVYNPDPGYLRAAVASLRAQTWTRWELCLADDCSTDPATRPLLEDLAAEDPRIRIAFREGNGHIAAATNTALAMARHDFAALMDQDDVLPPDALSVMADAIRARPEGRLFFSDEDKITDAGELRSPYLKPQQWDAELARGQNYVSHFGVYRMDRLRDIGGFRNGFPGSQDYDMMLRFTETLQENEIVHVPKVLYHWRIHPRSTSFSGEAKPEAHASGLKALQEHLDRLGVRAKAVPASSQAIFYRVRYALPSPPPPVTLIVDVGAAPSPLPSLLNALRTTTDYPALELLVVHTSESFARASGRGRELTPALSLRFLRLGENDLRLRANAAAKEARGEVLGFWGSGIAPLRPDWCAELVSRLCQPGVGVVGGKIVTAGEKVEHLGYVADADGVLFALFRGLDRRQPGYFGWTHLARAVAAVDPRNLFTRKDLFERSGGFDPSMGDAAPVDLCLRLSASGLRTVLTPFAEFRLSRPEPIPWERDNAVAHPALRKRWGGSARPCVPALARLNTVWGIHWLAEDDTPSTTAF